MGASGTVDIDFGAAPGSQVASAVITGQSGILEASSLAEAWIAPGSTSDHNDISHDIIDLYSKVRAQRIVDATGFTITATSLLRLTGTVKVAWVWN